MVMTKCKWSLNMWKGQVTCWKSKEREKIANQFHKQVGQQSIKRFKSEKGIQAAGGRCGTPGGEGGRSGAMWLWQVKGCQQGIPSHHPLLQKRDVSYLPFLVEITFDVTLTDVLTLLDTHPWFPKLEEVVVIQVYEGKPFLIRAQLVPSQLVG